MRSFFALASLAFVAVASALPAGIARGADLVGVTTTVTNTLNDLGVLKGSSINVANANAEQSHAPRGVPGVPNLPTAPHTGIVDVDTLVAHNGDNIQILPNSDINVANANANQHTGRDVVNHGLGDILVKLKADIHTLCHDLNVAINAAVSADAALDISLQVLAKIKVLLADVTVEIKALVDAHIDGALCLNGGAITVQIVAEILADIVAAVVVTIGLVLRACATVKTDVLLNLIVDVTVALTACINVAALIAVSVVFEVKPLIQAVVSIIVDLHLDVLIKLFALGGAY